jgi:hypothetical protein
MGLAEIPAQKQARLKQARLKQARLTDPPDRGGFFVIY